MKRTMTLTRRLCLFAPATILAACGFRPVYMSTATGKPGPAQRDLASIYVELIPERPGQLLRQALQERFGSDAAGQPLAYDLHVSFSIAGAGIAIVSNTAPTRIRLTGTATWTLSDRTPKRATITRGSARSVDGFDIQDQQYFASDLSNEVVQRRLAEAVADQIALQLAVYFRRQAGLT